MHTGAALPYLLPAGRPPDTSSACGTLMKDSGTSTVALFCLGNLSTRPRYEAPTTSHCGQSIEEYLSIFNSMGPKPSHYCTEQVLSNGFAWPIPTFDPEVPSRRGLTSMDRDESPRNEIEVSGIEEKLNPFIHSHPWSAMISAKKILFP